MGTGTQHPGDWIHPRQGREYETGRQRERADVSGRPYAAGATGAHVDCIEGRSLSRRVDCTRHRRAKCHSGRAMESVLAYRYRTFDVDIGPAYHHGCLATLLAGISRLVARTHAGAAPARPTRRCTCWRAGSTCVCVDRRVLGSDAAYIFHACRNCRRTLVRSWHVGFTHSGLGLAGRDVARSLGRARTGLLVVVWLCGDDFLCHYTSYRPGGCRRRRGEYPNRGHAGIVACHAGVVSGSLHYLACGKCVRHPRGQSDCRADHARWCLAALRLHSPTGASGDVVVLCGTRFPE